MDLHLTGARPTPEEKAAVDLELGGGPESVWEGGAPGNAADTRSASGGNQKAESQRHLLLPVLHAIQNRIGWISQGAMNYAALRLDVPPAEVYGVASFYGMFSLQSRPAVVAHICDDIACMARGSEELCDQLDTRLGPEGLPCAGGRAMWVRSNCLGLCERAPAVLVMKAGKKPQQRVLAPATADRVQSMINDAANDVMPAAPDVLNPQLSVPQEGSRMLVLLRRVGKSNAPELDGYQRLGGYEALRKAFELGPEGVLREMNASRLLGRGGAAFPAAKKWEALHLQRDLLKSDPDRKHYVICNADESEPGTFKDRLIMEGDPFAVLEGMTIA
ncbi:MAG: NAD(P)H-dependent oxidoreductase subunit E, partial [Candidatus Angelobacter sp.]